MIGKIERALQVATKIIETKRPLYELGRPYKRQEIVCRQSNDLESPYE